MEFWLSKGECCGCASCKNICSKNAISFTEWSDGFMYPNIDTDKCVNCGKCKSSCPVYNKKTYNKLKAVISRRTISKVYSVYNKDNEIRKKSTSGGVFSALATIFLKNGGVVFGATYDHLKVKHICITNLSELNKLRKSKYIQSEIGDCYRLVKKYLQDNIKVLWVGSPCQVSGLYEFLGKDDNNLTTIEFICHGVNSPGVYMKWLEGIERKKSKKVREVWFKYKDKGWLASVFRTRIDFDDNTYIVLGRKSNYFMRGFLEGSFFLRDSCHDCAFKGEDRSADLVIGDFWGITYDDDLGTSVVLVNSPKGDLLFSEVKDCLIIKEQELENIIPGNPRFLSSEPRSVLKDSFYKYLQIGTFEYAIKKVLPRKTIIQKLIRKMKKLTRLIIK